MSSSNRSVSHHEVETVGYLSASNVIDGLIDALTAALRTGVPVTHRPGIALFDAGPVTSTVDIAKQQRESLQRDLAEAVTATSAARELAVNAWGKGDQEAASEYDNDARRHRAKAQRLKAALDSLRTKEQPIPTDRPFDVQGDIWGPALHSIRASRGELNQTEINALNIILPQLRFEHVNHRWQGVAMLRITTTEGTAELGPIRWDIDTSARGTQLISRARKVQRAVPETRRKPELLAALVDSGNITRAAAMTAINAPFPDLRSLLLHTLRDEPWPESVDHQWKDDVFTQWVHDIYTDPNWQWLGNGRYFCSSALRQFAAHVVAREGSCTVTDLSSKAHLHVLNSATLCGDIDTNKSVRPFGPTLNLTKVGAAKSTHLLTPILCGCGNAATIVARVPEVPTDLLCRCGRMPDRGRNVIPAGLRFPDAYRDLELSESHCLAELKSRARRRESNIPPRSRRVLEALASGQPMTEKELSIKLGVNGISSTLTRLHGQGLIQRDTPPSRRWHLADRELNPTCRVDAE